MHVIYLTYACPYHYVYSHCFALRNALGVPWRVIKLFLSFKPIFFRLFNHLILGIIIWIFSTSISIIQHAQDDFKKGYGNIKLVDNGCKFVIIILETCVTMSGTRKHMCSHESTRVCHLSYSWFVS